MAAWTSSCGVSSKRRPSRWWSIASCDPEARSSANPSCGATALGLQAQGEWAADREGMLMLGSRSAGGASMPKARRTRNAIAPYPWRSRIALIQP
eukprot:14920888-Alexandrium_andersonii.AAC.1